MSKINTSVHGVCVTDALILNNVVIEYAVHGLFFSGSDMSVTSSYFRSSGDAPLVSLSDVTNVALTNCSFQSADVAIDVTSANGLTVQQCSFYDNNIGIRVQLSFNIPVDILRNIFDGNYVAIIAQLQSNGRLNIVNNIIMNSLDQWWYSRETSGLYALLSSECTLNVRGNELSNLRGCGLNIVRDADYGLAKVWISGNSFHNISSTGLTMTNTGGTITSIEDNKFAWNTCQMCPSALSLTVNIPSDGVRGDLGVSFNQFTGNSGSYIVYVAVDSIVVTSGPNVPNLFFTYNTLSDNVASSAVMYSEYSFFDVVFNIFSNPKSTFEFKVGFAINLRENCTDNWWIATNSTEVEKRIFDQNDNTSLGIAEYEPFLKTLQFSCAAVSECSRHGSCIFQDVCQCDDGWKGPDCSQVSCSSARECNGHGVCVGPNVCNCTTGWTGADCSSSTCYQVNNCSSQIRGTCIAPNK